MEPKYWVAVGAGFVALNLVYAGTVVLSFATYGRSDADAVALAVDLLDSPIGYLVVLVFLGTVAGAIHLHRRGDLR